MRDLPLQERVRQRFKMLVDTREVSHETLGKYLGLSRSGVTRLLNDEGSGIGLHHIERLCEFFQVTPVEILADACSRLLAADWLGSAVGVEWAAWNYGRHQSSRFALITIT